MSSSRVGILLTNIPMLAVYKLVEYICTRYVKNCHVIIRAIWPTIPQPPLFFTNVTKNIFTYVYPTAKCKTGMRGVCVTPLVQIFSNAQKNNPATFSLVTETKDCFISNNELYTPRKTRNSCVLRFRY